MSKDMFLSLLHAQKIEILEHSLLENIPNNFAYSGK